MVLPSSGQISFANINIELGRNSTASISIDTAESDGYGCIQHCSGSRPNDARPAAISEWYGYDHSKKASITFDWDGPYATEALLCADTSIPAGVTLFNYAPTNFWYSDLTLGECCRGACASGYYRNVINIQNWLNVVGCVGTTGSCAPPPPPTCPSGQYGCGSICCNDGTVCCSDGISPVNYCCPSGAVCNGGTCAV